MTIKKLASFKANWSAKKLDLSKILLLISAGFFVLVLSGLIYKAYLRERNYEILRKQLVPSLYSLSNLRNQIKSAQVEKEAAEIIAENKKNEVSRYFSSVPLVIATLDGKGRLVGFSRLLENGGQAQYSFQIVHEGENVNVSGTITNQAGKLSYSDDYNTNYDVRTGGEITHSKTSARLNIVFVVTSTNSKNYRIGDTFTASFVLPAAGVVS